MTSQDSLEEQAAAEPASSYQVADPSESIWVTVDPQGLLVDVMVRRTWPEHIEPATFGDALLAAYLAAARKAVVAMLSTMGEEPPKLVATEGELSNEEWLTQLRIRLDDVDAKLRAMAQAESTVPEEQEFRGRNGYLTLLLGPSGPAGITTNPAAAYAELALLREDALDVFEDAGLLTEEETR